MIVSQDNLIGTAATGGQRTWSLCPFGKLVNIVFASANTTPLILCLVASPVVGFGCDTLKEVEEATPEVVQQP